MSEAGIALFLFLKDYTDDSNDRFFLWSEGSLKETAAIDLISFKGSLLCHDYWLIARSIYKTTGRLPDSVIDLEDFRVSTCGIKDERILRDKKISPYQWGWWDCLKN